MSQDKISVIMGVYQADIAMLQQAIDSILAQTYRDFVFIICDDGSQNQTYEWLQHYQEKDNRIILLRNSENLGLAAALNRCIDRAEGEWLVRQDADDWSAPDRLEQLVKFWESHPQYDLVSSNLSLFDQTGNWGEMRYPLKPQAKDFLFCIPFMHGAVAMKKSAVVRAGGYRVAKETRRCEDIDLFMRMYAQGSQGYTIQKPLYHYREDQNAKKKRKYRYKIEEAKVKYAGFQRLGLMPKGYLYVLKPLLVGLIPGKLLDWMKDRYYHRRK